MAVIQTAQPSKRTCALLHISSAAYRCICQSWKTAGILNSEETSLQSSLLHLSTSLAAQHLTNRLNFKLNKRNMLSLTEMDGKHEEKAAECNEGMAVKDCSYDFSS